LRWAVDVVSKPRIWNYDALAVLLRKPVNLPNYRGRTPLTSSPQRAGVISMLELSILSAYAVRSASDIEEHTSANEPLLECICTFLVLLIITKSSPS